jgi:hypothetical protein
MTLPPFALVLLLRLDANSLAFTDRLHRKLTHRE